MFELEENGIYPLIRVATPADIDFLGEHRAVIQQHGYVWFCRFGKNNMKIQSLQDCKHIMIVKDADKNGGKVYLAMYDEVLDSLNLNCEAIPNYYLGISRHIGAWIRVTQIEEISKATLEECFVVSASNGKVSNILRSMCPATFLRCVRSM